MWATPGYSRSWTCVVAIADSRSRKGTNSTRLFERVTANSKTGSCHLVKQTHRLHSSLTLMIAYGQTLMTSRYATSRTHSSVRHTRWCMRRMCDNCCSDSGNSASIAKLRCVNLEFWKSASWGLLSFPIESAWNQKGSPSSRTGWHRSQLETSRCFSDWWSSTQDSSGHTPRWPFYWQNYYRQQRQAQEARKGYIQPDGNGRGKPNWRSGHRKWPSARHQSSSISIRQSRTFSKQTRVDLRFRAFSISTTIFGFLGQSISTPGSALQLNRITTLMIGSYWPLWVH